MPKQHDEYRDVEKDMAENNETFSELETKKLKKLAFIIKELDAERTVNDKKIKEIVEKYDTVFQKSPDLNCYMIAVLISKLQNYKKEWEKKEMTDKILKEIKKALKEKYKIEPGEEMSLDICRYKIFLDRVFTQEKV